MDTSRERSEVRILSIDHLAHVRHWLIEHLHGLSGGDALEGDRASSERDRAPVSSSSDAASSAPRDAS